MSLQISLNHFLPGTPVLSFGAAGRNLACKFCQNWDISKSREIDTLADAAAPAALANAAETLGCRSVAFTYNDPTIFLEYTIDVADACRERGIRAIAVSAGYICAEPRRDLYAHMDAANIDLKAFTPDFYHRVCAGHLDAVLETLEYLRHETDVWFEITTLLIPGHNDSDAEIDAETRWIAEHLGLGSASAAGRRRRGAPVMPPRVHRHQDRVRGSAWHPCGPPREQALRCRTCRNRRPDSYRSASR